MMKQTFKHRITYLYKLYTWNSIMLHPREYQRINNPFNATFDADGWPNYSPVSEHSPAKWGRLQLIWFVQKTTIAQTSQPSLMFLYKADEFRGLWNEQKLWNQKIHAAPSRQGQLTCHLPDHQKQNKWPAEHLSCISPIWVPITAY